MLLTIPERYALIPLLPQKGDFQTLTRVKNLTAALVLGDEEAVQRGLTLVGEQILADAAAQGRDELGIQTDVPVHEAMVEIIKKTLKDLEASGELSMRLLDLYDRLIREPDNAVVREAEAVAGAHE